MKNSGHFVIFLKNYIKLIKNNSINEEVFNEKFTKIDLIDFVFIKLFWCLIKKNLMTNILILLKILFNKKKEIYVKSNWLMHNSLEVYAFYLGIGKLITSITMQFFMFFFTMFIELGVELKRTLVKN